MTYCTSSRAKRGLRAQHAYRPVVMLPEEVGICIRNKLEDSDPAFVSDYVVFLSSLFWPLLLLHRTPDAVPSKLSDPSKSNNRFELTRTGAVEEHEHYRML
jgi:hypothetical protein